MWSFEHSVITQAAPAKVWALWQDVGTWNTWDEAVEWVRLDGAFATGSRGTLKPKGGPRTAFTLTDVVREKAFSDLSRLPLTTMRFSHRLDAVPEGTRVVHRIEMQGPLAWLFSRLIGPGFVKDLPHAMASLVAKAEAT